MNGSHGGVHTFFRWLGWFVVVGWALQGISMVPHSVAGNVSQQVVHLYFADAKKPFLVGESRLMINSGDPISFGRQIVTALINGSNGGALATIPAGTQLRAFFILGDGTAVVDFSNHIRNNHSGSCRQEKLTLFSVVNSLALNVTEIDQVKILIDGTEARTLTGHLALEFPLTADLLLTR